MIDYESERVALNQIIETLNRDSLPAVILANINLSGRQIDIVVATESMVLVVEAKKCTRPIRGDKNGRWEFKSAIGEWIKYSGNFYQQTLDEKHALKDALQSTLEINNLNYPDAALVFSQSISEGSEIPSSDYKVNIGDISLLKDFTFCSDNSVLSLSQWRSFAEQHHLIKVDLLQSAYDQRLSDSELTLNNYKNAFVETYQPITRNLIPFSCSIEGTDITSNDVIDNKFLNKDLLIVGPSGCAKSMLAINIGLSCIANDRIPIIVEGKYFEKEFGSLLNQEVSLLDIPSITSHLAACKHLERPLTIILDGFNECTSALHKRLARCLRATAIRHHTNIVITSQHIFNELELLNLETIHIPAPSLEVKKRIAKTTIENEHYSKIEELLDLVHSGLEADIIGQISKEIAPKASRYALFDTYIRKRLGDTAQDGIRMLTHIGNYLSENITFSMSVRDFDRLLDANTWPASTPKRLLATDLLTTRGDRVSFGHELYLNVFSAEAVIRRCGNNADDILSALTAPQHASYKTLIIGAIDNTNLLDKVLFGIKDSEIIAASISGECGEYAQTWVRNHFLTVLQKIKKEAETVEFITGGHGWGNVSTKESTLQTWSTQDNAFVNSLSILLGRGLYLDDIFDIAGIMDETLHRSFDILIEEARKKKIALRSGLFMAGFVNQNSDIAISRTIACIGFHSFSDKQSNHSLVGQWIETTLSDHELSNGQLLIILKLGRYRRDIDLFSQTLPDLIKNRWKYAPYHLLIDLLDAAQGFWEAEKGTKDKLIGAINEIKTENIWISTSIIDALKGLGALEDIAYEETVASEINEVLNDPENPENWTFAQNIYTRQFDHPYDSAYCEVISELPDIKKKQFLSMAVRAKSDFRMFVSCMIRDLADFRDVSSGEYIVHWTELSPKENFMPQDATEVFVISHIVLGVLQFPLPVKNYNNSDEDNAILACGEIYYLMSQADISLEERKERSKEALGILMRHELGVALSAIKECESTLRIGLNRLLDQSPIKPSIIENFPEEFTEICRNALDGKVTQKGRLPWPKEEEILSYAINMLGHFGKTTDIPLLRRMVNHQYFGSTVISSIQKLENNQSST